LAVFCTPFGFAETKNLSSPPADSSVPPTAADGRSIYRVEEGAGMSVEPPAFSPMLACTATYLRGDFNEDRNRTLEDVVQMISCVFYGFHTSRLCLTCVCDMNCDQRVTPADVLLELRMYALGPPTSRIRIICLEED
jgi:hypothetical protein